MYNAYQNSTYLPAFYSRHFAHHVTECFYRDEAQESLTDLIHDGWQAIMIRELAKNGIHCGMVTFVKDGIRLYRNSDGKRYHITISLSKDRRPVESNDLIREFEENGGTLLDADIAEDVFIPLNLTPIKRFK